MISIRAANGAPNQENQMADLDELINELVLANRILAGQGVVDAFGHVSVRHPERADRHPHLRQRQQRDDKRI